MAVKRGEESFRTVVWQSFAARGPRIRVDFLKNNNEVGRSSVNRSISSIKIERQVLNIRHVKLRIGVTYCKEVEHRSCFFCRENYGDLPHHRAYKSSYRILAIEPSLPFPPTTNISARCIVEEEIRLTEFPRFSCSRSNFKNLG